MPRPPRCSRRARAATAPCGPPRVGATCAPHALRAGGAHQRDIGAVDERLARRRAPAITSRCSRRPARRTPTRRGPARPSRPSRSDGVIGDGFHTTVSPQTRATAVFQDHTAHGKLNAVMTADHAQRVPRLHQPVAWPLGRHRAPIELARQPDREVADVDRLLHLAEGLRADLAGLDRDQLGDVRLVLAQQLAQRLTNAPRTGAGYGAPLTKRILGRRRSPPPPPPVLRRVRRTAPRP